MEPLDKKIRVYNENIAIAVGNNIISYTKNGADWYNISHINESFLDVFILDENTAIAVGFDSKIYYSLDGFINWKLLSEDMINGSGQAFQLIQKWKLSNIYMPDKETFVISNIITEYEQSSATGGNTNLIHLYYPDLFNRADTSVLDVVGSIDICGNILIKDDGKIISTNETFDILNDTVKTINFGNDTTTINIGGENTKINITGRIDDNVKVQNLDVINDTSLNNNLFVSGDASFNSTMKIQGDVTIEKNLIVNTDTSLNTLNVSGETNMNSNVSINNSTLTVINGNIVQF